MIVPPAVDNQTLNFFKGFEYNAGWRTEKHVRLLADTTGDKTADIVGFGEDGVWISLNKGNNTFTKSQKVLSEFGYASGWRVDKHIRFMADIRNVGRCDIVGFGDAGVFVSQNNGNGHFSPATLVLKDFGCDQDWRLDRHLRFLADVTGDGFLDIVGFGEAHVYVCRNNGNGMFAPSQAVTNDFVCAGWNWQIEKHPRILADLTGDGTVDIIGFADSGVYVSLNNGRGSFRPMTRVVDSFGINSGWQVNKNPRFIADLTGDKRGDIIGFGDANVHVSFNNGDGTFRQGESVLNNFCVQQGWEVGQHPRFVVDLKDDGRADIIGFGSTGVFVSFNDGKGIFGPILKLVDFFGLDRGWSMDKTVRYVTNLPTFGHGKMQPQPASRCCDCFLQQHAIKTEENDFGQLAKQRQTTGACRCHTLSPSEPHRTSTRVTVPLPPATSSTVASCVVTEVNVWLQ